MQRSINLNLRHTSTQNLLSKSYKNRSNEFKEDIQYFFRETPSNISSTSTSPGSHSEELLLKNYSSGDEQENFVGINNQNKSQPKEHEQKIISTVSGKNIVERTKLDPVTLGSYLKFTSILLGNRGEINYEEFMTVYKNSQSSLKKIFGYKTAHFLGRDLAPFFYKNFNTEGEIVTTRLKLFLAEVMCVDPKEIVENHSKLKETFNEFVVKLAKAGHKDFSINLEGLDLSNQKFDNCDFHCADFSDCNLENTIFEGCDLRASRFLSANIDGCKLIRCKAESAYFDSPLHASEISMTPVNTLYKSGRFKVNTKNNPITKDAIFSIINTISDMSDLHVAKLNELIKFPLKNGQIINRECLITLEEVDLSKACAVREPNGIIRLYNANALWNHFKVNPRKCPLNNKTETLKFLSIYDISELI